MKLWILSDMHVERGVEDIAVDVPDFDIFVCAGDVVTSDIDMAIEMVASLAHGKSAVFVAGNHEWWGGPPELVEQKGRRAAERHRVAWLERSAVSINGIRFAGATLWTPHDARYTPSAAALAALGADIVVTHFGPGPELLLPTLKAGGVWIHGHHHGFSDRSIGGRRIVRNAGYPGEITDGELVRQDYVLEFEP